MTLFLLLVLLTRAQNLSKKVDNVNEDNDKTLFTQKLDGFFPWISIYSKIELNLLTKAMWKIVYQYNLFASHGNFCFGSVSWLLQSSSYLLMRVLSLVINYPKLSKILWEGPSTTSATTTTCDVAKRLWSELKCKRPKRQHIQGYESIGKWFLRIWAWCKCKSENVEWVQWLDGNREENQETKAKKANLVDTNRNVDSLMCKQGRRDFRNKTCT